MRTKMWKFALGAVAAAAMTTGAVAETPKSGGTLNFVVGSKIPSYDGHIETTFGMIHPISPFYSLLIRVNPDNPSENDFQCDVCSSWDASADGLTYTYKIRDDVKFHDGTPMTAQDVLATYNKIVFPPEGVASSRKAFYKMVKSMSAPDDTTFVMNLEYPSGAYLPAMASPFNYIYSKKDLDEHGMNWHQKNVNGSGPFKFVQHQPGAFVEGVKYDGYHHEGRPYLDGFKAISAPKMSARVQAIEGDRASIEFRAFPPKQRDDLVAALGDKITVQESDWNCVLMATPNHERPPFDDPRVRKALTLAIDRWGGSEYLSKIAIVKTVGGIVFPNHPLAATEEELVQIAGYSKDLEASREEARRLLKEAGAEGLKFTFNNRGVDQPYRVVGTWLVDQWKQVGLEVDQQVNPSPVFYDILRKTGEFDVSIDFNCQSVINPIADVSKFLPSAGNNYANFEDAEIEALYDKLARAGTFEEQRALMREYETMVLNDKATQAITLWWYKINPYRSYVKGWKIAPSHYLGQQLDQIWLDK
ncbi:MAG: ABC transporter substrate-binding protein [Paracoccaceae bacterium]|nr:ABC transporter substrate-binding protein [Paracoccaceae bacterium]